MALTALQREICRLIAENRVASGESYVAGGAALNELLSAPRVSRDLDLFHDTAEALAATWEADRRLLREAGFELKVVRERPTFVEAMVERGTERALLQWAQDSAYRFFPLVQREPFGLTLHPFDLATNKVLALVGRVEVRDWVDTIESDGKIQPLGYLAWAASGKDPGFSPLSILEQAARTARYSADEVASLEFEGIPPDAGVLARRWRALLEAAGRVVQALPVEKAGHCVLRREGGLCVASPEALPSQLARGDVVFHEGSIRGALPDLMAGGR